MSKLLSFHSDPKIKEKYLKRVRAHAKADEIIKGKYWQDGAAYQTELGLPEWLAKLEDALFEGLPKGHAAKFPARFLSAIPIGADLEPVKYKFTLILLAENAERVSHLTIDDSVKAQILSAIDQVAAVNRDALATGVVNDAARTAADAARSAAWSVADAARTAAYIRYAAELIKLLKAA